MSRVVFHAEAEAELIAAAADSRPGFIPKNRGLLASQVSCPTRACSGRRCAPPLNRQGVRPEDLHPRIRERNGGSQMRDRGY